jgi:hypothetical protein
MTRKYEPLSESIRVRCPRQFPQAILTAAARQMCSPAEYTRRALVEKLRADGVDPLSVISQADQAA